MNFDKYTIKAQETVQEAVNIAQRAGQQSIEPVHLLKALLEKLPMLPITSSKNLR